MSVANFFKNLPRCLTNRGIKVAKSACNQEFPCIPVRKISCGSILKTSEKPNSILKTSEKPNPSTDDGTAEKPNTTNDDTASCYKDVCVAEGVVVPKPEKMTAEEDYVWNNPDFDGPFRVPKPAGWKPKSKDTVKEVFTNDNDAKNKAWMDNTVQEVFINNNDIGSDIVCDKNYCVGEGVAFHKSSVEPNYAPLFDMFDKGVICNEEVCVSEGVVFSRDELNDVATQHVDENHTNDTTVKKNCPKDDFDEKVELFYTELDFLNFDNSVNGGNVYWSQAGRSSLDVELLAPLVDVFDKGMVCNEHVCVSEGVAFHKDQLKDEEVSAKKD